MTRERNYDPRVDNQIWTQSAFTWSGAPGGVRTERGDGQRGERIKAEQNKHHADPRENVPNPLALTSTYPADEEQDDEELDHHDCAQASEGLALQPGGENSAKTRQEFRR